MSVDRRHFLGGLAALGVGAVTGLPSRQAQAGLFNKKPLIVNGLETSILDKKLVEMMRKGGVHCVHRSVGDAVSIGEIHYFIEKNSDDLMLAKTVADVYQAKKRGRIAVVLGCQSAAFVEERLRKSGRHDTIAKTLQAYHGLGLRILGICYNNNNIFGGGNLNPDSPLTRAGRVLVDDIHSLNIILDVGGHMGERSSLDAIAMSEGVPVICSHTNMAGLMPNVRAISNQLCDAIARTGGVIGITAISDFHTRSIENYKQHGAQSPQASLDQHLDQYDYVKNLVGIDHVALGSDFFCGSEERFEKLLTNLDGNLYFSPEMLSEGSPKLVEDYKDISEVGNVIKGLKDRGWSREELNKLLGGNWLRVYKQVWGR